MTAGPARAASIADALTFIGTHSHVYLLGRRPDGYPTGWAMTARARDDAVDFSTYRASAKVRHLAAAGVASVLAMSDDRADHCVLLAEGPLAVLDGAVWFDDDAPVAARPDVHRQVPAEVVEKVASRHESGKRCVLRVTIERARFSERLV
ncbi:MAG TPA: hypothetical protein VFZ17_00440 [Acidimicrobiia bacterium]|nr:hypothetical protein [Acidimicrobiia bacterium]